MSVEGGLGTNFLWFFFYGPRTSFTYDFLLLGVTPSSASISFPRGYRHPLMVVVDPGIVGRHRSV